MITIQEIALLVSVSLRSIIHSYEGGILKKREKRIFTEFPSPYGVSFILLVVIGGYMSWKKSKKFPSPYGVSFILIENKAEEALERTAAGFRLLTEYHSFL